MSKGAMEEYAKAVADGFRPILTQKWPTEISTLLQNCWAEEPQDRPSMTSVISQLEEFYKNST